MCRIQEALDACLIIILVIGDRFKHVAEKAEAHCVREALRTRHYSLKTEKAYVHWIRLFIRFHGKHPTLLEASLDWVRPAHPDVKNSDTRFLGWRGVTHVTGHGRTRTDASGFQFSSKRP